MEFLLLEFYNIVFKNKNFPPQKKCFIVEPKVILQAPGIPPEIWDLHGDTSDCIAQGIQDVPTEPPVCQAFETQPSGSSSSITRLPRKGEHSWSWDGGEKELRQDLLKL